MELRQIQYFIHLYKSGSITKSSQSLFISQQGLSKSIQKLEEEIGFPLFRRSVYGMTPTMAANNLYKYFCQVDDAFQSLKYALEGYNPKKDFRIRGMFGLSMSSSGKLFDGFQQLYPEISVEYKESPYREIPEILRENRADVAFMIEPIPEDLVSRKLVGKEIICAVMNKSHPLADREILNISELTSYPWVFLDIIEQIKSLISEESRHVSRNCKTVSFLEYLHEIRSSEQIGFSSKSLLRYLDQSDLKIIPVTCNEKGEFYKLILHLVTGRGKPVDDTLKLYLDYLKGISRNTENHSEKESTRKSNL
ncbi:MAG: LysR family transcriptional regulator [Eubacterium sp.]|nr:LysR family transcriptional regulator [Eubacterium sp.]